MDIQPLVLTLMALPLIGALSAGLWGEVIGRRGAHWMTCSLMGAALLLACYLGKLYFWDQVPVYEDNLYAWAISGDFHFYVGFLIDKLTVTLFITVTFVSFLVHLYSIGYMEAEKEGYQRFFSYISLFTFAMLMLVSANNFLQLFFGWEGVGLVSYLLIGFWFKKESAIAGSLKAFLVNRIGDIGLVLGIAIFLAHFETLNYTTLFQALPAFAQQHPDWVTTACLLLFVGAMGKSAQMPLHIWLPESMEGPTPISALIHAATMVTAGVYLVARLAPLYQLSPTALSVILVVGSSTAFFMGILGIVQNDIKRVVAYSTLSQLGYMVAGLGASAFHASIFHLVTHSAFKALLFLAAGSIIIALHHEQDLRKMGGLRKKLPLTYVTFLVGALALCALPPFAGFYSKEAIIDAVGESHLWGATYAHWLLTAGAFITSLYTFRAFFKVFHGKPTEHSSSITEPTWTMRLPLIALAIPSVALGFLLVNPLLSHSANWYDPLRQAIYSVPLGCSLAGVAVAWLCWVKYPLFPQKFTERLPWLYQALSHKYGFDWIHEKLLVPGICFLSEAFHRRLDNQLIDHKVVNGSGRLVLLGSRLMKQMQSGYLSHYLLATLLGLIGFLVWQLLI